MKFPIGFLNPLRRENESLKTKIQILRKETTTHKSMFQKMRKEIDEHIKQLEAVHHQKKEIQKQLLNNEQANQALIEQNKKLESEKEKLMKSNDELIGRHETFCKENPTYKENDDLRKENERLRSEILLLIIMNEEIKNLCKKSPHGRKILNKLESSKVEDTFVGKPEPFLFKDPIDFRPEASFRAKSEGDAAMVSRPSNQGPIFR